MDIAQIMQAAIMRARPSDGGLSVRQVQAPYGLRSYIKPDGSYGGQQMPKGEGWLGQVKSKNGDISTELSVEDESGMYPLIVPTLDNSQLQGLLSARSMDEIPDIVYQKAKQHAEAMKGRGRSPFREIWE